MNVGDKYGVGKYADDTMHASMSWQGQESAFVQIPQVQEKQEHIITYRIRHRPRKLIKTQLSIAIFVRLHDRFINYLLELLILNKMNSVSDKYMYA